MKKRLSECETLEDLEHFIPTNPDRLYYDGKGTFYDMDTVSFLIGHVSNLKATFKPVIFCSGYFKQGGTYNVLDNIEFFCDEDEAKEYKEAKDREAREKRIHELESELAVLKLKNSVGA